MPFDFNSQQPSKPTSKTDKPSFDFGINTISSADKSNTPTFDFRQGSSTSKPADKNAAATKKSNIASIPGSKPTSKPESAKTDKNGLKPAESSGRGKQSPSKNNPFQDKRVILFAGIGVVLLLLIIVAIASNSGKSEPAPQQTVQKKLSPEEARKEKLRKIQAKYDAQYEAEKRGPKTEKQKLMEAAESKLKSGDYRGAAEAYIKVHDLDPTDGYPVTQLINIYRNNLHDKAQLEKWEQINNEIAKDSLDQLQKKSKDKYNKSKE